MSDTNPYAPADEAPVGSGTAEKPVSGTDAPADTPEPRKSTKKRS